MWRGRERERKRDAIVSLKSEKGGQLRSDGNKLHALKRLTK